MCKPLGFYNEFKGNDDKTPWFLKAIVIVFFVTMLVCFVLSFES